MSGWLHRFLSIGRRILAPARFSSSLSWFSRPGIASAFSPIARSEWFMRESRLMLLPVIGFSDIVLFCVSKIN